jgi:chromosome segregation ATPase
MIAKFKRLGSTACRIQITIDLQELDIAKQLDDINLVCIEFERKTKSICSQSKIWSGNKAARSIVFDEALTLLITLYKDSAGLFLEKNGNLVLKGYSEKTASSIKLGSVPLKLSVLAADYSTQKLLLKLVDDKGRPVGTLNLTVTAKFLRDIAPGDDESSVGSFTSELRSLSVPVNDRLSHGVLYKESSPSKMYALDVSSAETDRYRRSLRPSASRGASFTVGTKDLDGCERDDSVDSVMSGDMSPSKHRRDSMMSVNTNDISTHQYDEMIEILNKNKQLQAEIDDLTGQLYRAGKKHTVAEERIEAFQKAEVISASQIKTLKENLAQSDARYSDKDAVIAKLTEEKRALKLELSKEQQNTTSLTNAIAGLRKDVHTAQCESAAVQAAVLTIEMQKLQSSMLKMKEQAAVSLTDRSILLSELESTKTLLLESEEKVLSIRNDKKIIELTAEKQKLADEKALTEKKLKALEDVVQDYEVEKKMVDRKEVDATKVAVESAQRYDSMVAKMQAKNEKITTELNKWKARYDESSSKHQAVTAAGQKSQTVNKEAIINLQLELEESLNQLATAWETTGEQSKSMEQSAKKIKELEGKLLELQGELDTAKKDKVKAEKATADSKSEMDVFKLVCDTERNSLNEKIEELTASNADLEQMSSELQVEVEMMSSQSSDKSKNDLNEREKIKSELADIKKSLSTSEALTETLQTQATASSASYKESQALVASLKAEVAQTKKDLAASQEALNSLEADIEKTMTDWTEKEEAMEQHEKLLTEKITEFEEKEIFSSKLVADLDTRLKTKTEDYDGLKKVGEGLKKELTDLRGKIERREKTITSLKGSQSVEMEKMVKEMDELKNNFSDQEIELTRRNKAIDTLKAELAEQLAESEKRGKEVKSLKSELLDQVAELERKVKEIDSLKEELSDKSLEIEKRDKTIETLRSDIADQSTEIKKREKGIESLRGDQTAEVEKMAKALQALKEELEDKVEEMEKREKLIKASKDEVSDQVAENEKRSKAIKLLRGELSDQAALTEKKEKEVEVLRGELSDLTIEIERRGREIKGLRSELADQKAAQDKRGKENESLAAELADQAAETEKREKIIESLRGDQTIEMEKTLKAMQALKEELASQVVELEKFSRESKGLRISLTDQKLETEKREKIIEALRGDQTAEMEKMVKDMGAMKSAQALEVQKIAKEVADSKAQLSSEMAKMAGSIAALKAEVAGHVAEAEKRTEEIKELRSELADQVDETEMRVRDVENITEELAEQVTETVRRDEIIKSLKGDKVNSAEAERVQGELTALRAAQAEQAIESAKQVSTIAELRSELAGKVTKMELLMKEMEMLKEDLADQVTEVENIGMVVDALKEELTDQAEKVQSLQNDIEDYKAEMEEKTGEMEKMERALEAMKSENVLLSKQLEEKGSILSTAGGDDLRLSEKETSYKNQLRMMMFEKKKVELELEKSQESGYALDLVSKQNISAITAEKDRLEMMIKKLKSQLTQSMDKANENIASFSAERQKLKADLVKIQRDADLVEVTSKTNVDEMTAEKEKMYVEWLDKTGKFDILAIAARDSKASYTAALKKNEIMQQDLVAMSRKAEGLITYMAHITVNQLFNTRSSFKSPVYPILSPLPH